MTIYRPLSYDEQKDKNPDGPLPRGICPTCTVEYRIMMDNRMRQHGARGNPCKGTHKVALGLSAPQEA
jgi:hypothetical protein